MIIKKFLMVFLISIFTFATITQAQSIHAISNTYKQGIYDFSKFSGYSGATAKLITPNTVVTLIVIDNNGNLKTFIQLNDVNEIVKLDSIQKEYIEVNKETHDNTNLS